MASIAYDDLLKAYEDTGASLCPEGTHDVKVVNAQYGETSSGRSQFVVQYEITAGPHAGRKVKHWMTIVPEYPGLVGQWFSQMAAMGLTREYFQAKPENDRVCADLTGRPCRIEVGRRKKRGTDEDTEDIKKVLPPLNAAVSPLAAPAVAPFHVPPVGAADPTAPAVPF